MYTLIGIDARDISHADSVKYASSSGRVLFHVLMTGARAVWRCARVVVAGHVVDLQELGDG
jgi:hypothetical protein